MVEVKILCNPSLQELADALLVRDIVFSKEQGFTIPDQDEFDEQACHVVLYEDGAPIATGRVFSEDGGETYHLGRIAVLRECRGRNLGARVMQELEKIAAERGAKKLVLGAQLHAVPFYQKVGFAPTGHRFFEEFCEHEDMTKDL